MGILPSVRTCRAARTARDCPCRAEGVTSLLAGLRPSRAYASHVASDVDSGADEDDDLVELIERPDASYQVMSSVRGFAPWIVHGGDLGTFLFGIFVYLPYRWLVRERRGHIVAAYRLPKHIGFHRPVALRLVPTEAESEALTQEWVQACKDGMFDREPRLSWWSRRKQLGVDLGVIVTALLILLLAVAFISVAGFISSLPDELF